MKNYTCDTALTAYHLSTTAHMSIYDTITLIHHLGDNITDPDQQKQFYTKILHLTYTQSGWPFLNAFVQTPHMTPLLAQVCLDYAKNCEHKRNKQSLTTKDSFITYLGNNPNTPASIILDMFTYPSFHIIHSVATDRRTSTQTLKTTLETHYPDAITYRNINGHTSNLPPDYYNNSWFHDGHHNITQVTRTCTVTINDHSFTQTFTFSTKNIERINQQRCETGQYSW